MAFFENLGDQISALGRKSFGKAKDLSESARLSAMVSEEERTVSDIYYQIGKLYASNHKADYEACFAELFARLAKSEDNIQRYKQQIMDLRGVQLCDRCGAEVPKGSQFCSACGAPVKPPVPAGCTLCPKCGAAVERGMRFCTSCGNPMNAPAEEEFMPEPFVKVDRAYVIRPDERDVTFGIPTAHTPDPVPAPAPSAGGSAFHTAGSLDDPMPLHDEPAPAPAHPDAEPAAARCPHCGAELEPDSVFCSECGQPV